VRYSGKIILDLANEFLHHGTPQKKLTAMINSSHPTAEAERRTAPERDFSKSLLLLLAHPNIASKAGIIRIYDHEVQGGTVIKPLSGIEMDAPSDACVIKPTGSKGLTGIAIANGINPEYGKRDAYRMATAVVDEAIRNLIASGADPERIALLDNFCWGDPMCPETLGSLVEAARGCHDAALLFRTPFISGKDSLNNEYKGSDAKRHSIPPTLLISAIGIMNDVSKAVTTDLKKAGNTIYLAGEFAPTFGGSHYVLVMNEQGNEAVPSFSSTTPKIYQAIHRSIQNGLVTTAHDLSEGGLAVAAAEMCIGGRMGLDLAARPDDGELFLFGETTGCLLVEVEEENKDRFEKEFIGLPLRKLGRVTKEPALHIHNTKSDLIHMPVQAIIAAWNTPF
jgi:phosphoribosylformylglycinamidine synthase